MSPTRGDLGRSPPARGHNAVRTRAFFLGMVMGPTHAVSGMAGWLLAAPVVTTVTGAAVSPSEMAVCSVVAAGSALLLDIDTSSSTVARSFGLPSQLVARLVSLASRSVYAVTRSRRDPPATDGHRALTHTLVFAVGLGLFVAAMCAHYGRVAALVVLFVTCGLAVRGLLAEWATRSGWVITTLVSSGVTWLASIFVAEEAHWLLGVAVGVGCVVHLAGDMITMRACPVLWPLPISGQRWRPIGPPRFLRIRAGGWVEKSLLLPGLSIAAAVLMWVTWEAELAFLMACQR